MTYRICRVLAVSQQVIKTRIMRNDLVLPKSLQQIGKLMLRNAEFAYRLTQRDEYRMPWLAVIALCQLSFPLVEQQEGLLLVADLIAQVIRDSTICIHVVEMLMQMLRQEPCNYRKILVMRRGEPHT